MQGTNEKTKYWILVQVFIQTKKRKVPLLAPSCKKTKCKNSHEKIKLKIELNWIKIKINIKFWIKKKIMKKIL